MDAEILAPIGAIAMVLGTAAGRVINKYRDTAWKRDAEAARADLDEYQTVAQKRIDRLQLRVSELEQQLDAAHSARNNTGLGS